MLRHLFVLSNQQAKVPSECAIEEKLEFSSFETILSETEYFYDVYKFYLNFLLFMI